MIILYRSLGREKSLFYEIAQNMYDSYVPFLDSWCILGRDGKIDVDNILYASAISSQKGDGSAPHLMRQRQRGENIFR